MQALRNAFILRIAPALALLAAFHPAAALAQSFVITGIPVAGSSGGTGTIQWTVSGIPFNGELIVGCQYAGSSTYQAQAQLPVCGAGPIAAGITVTAGQTVKGTISMTPWGTPTPIHLRTRPAPSRYRAITGLALAGVFALGLGIRRRRRGLFAFLIALSALAAASGSLACGGNSRGPVPGIYPYTVTATDNSTSPAILTAATSTSVSVTVQ